MWKETTISVLHTPGVQREQIAATRIAVDRATLAPIPRQTCVTKFDNDRVFGALLNDAFEKWEEWV